MKITHDWNSGNFTLSHSADITQEQLVTLASKGLLWHMQRNRKHDEILGAFETVNGKSKRKAGWKRNDVAYDSALASKLKESYSRLEIADGVFVPIETAIEEYTREAATLVYRDARNLLERKESDPWRTLANGSRTFADTLARRIRRMGKIMRKRRLWR